MNIEPEKKKGYIRRHEVLETYDLAETIEILQAYLNDEIEVIVPLERPKKKRRRRKRKLKIVRERTELEILLLSMEVISSRIINKYCNGEQPHPERIILRDLMLSILQELVDDGTVQDMGTIELNKCGLKFECACFASDEVDDIITLPLGEPTKTFGKIDDDIIIKSFSDIGKKQAQRNILSYYENRKQG